jgi:outer membrane protein OmpA-like peptidoglycan-associated protein
MENNLIEQAKQFISPDVISRLSNTYSEPRENVEKGMDAAIPSVFLGLINNSDNDLSSIINKAKQLFAGGNFSDIISGFGSTGSNSSELNNGNDLLGNIFGDKIATIVSSIASYAGLKNSSVHGILNSATPAAFGAISKNSNGWDVSTIKNLILENKNSLIAALPVGLSGLSSFSAFGDGLKDKITTNEPTYKAPVNVPPPHPVTPPPRVNLPEQPKSSSPWRMIIIVLVVLLLLYLFFNKGCTNTPKMTDDFENRTDTLIENVENSNVVTKVKELFKVSLPNGVELDAYKGGIEDQLVRFLKTDYKSLGADSLKNIWFDFDNLNFETGSAVITQESQPQLNNLAQILKAFPQTKIKIGGYTDKTGNESANQKISSDRANAVKSYLTDAGLGSQVDGAEGYGSQFAKYQADDDENDRVKDRRISVSVR